MARHPKMSTLFVEQRSDCNVDSSSAEQGAQPLQGGRLKFAGQARIACRTRVALTNDDTAGPSPLGSPRRAASIRVNQPFTAECTAEIVITGQIRQASASCSVVRAAMPAPTAIPAELCCGSPAAAARLCLLTLLLSSPPAGPSCKRGMSRSLSRMGGISRHALFPSSFSSGRWPGEDTRPLRLTLLRRALPELKNELASGCSRAARGSEDRGGTTVLSSGRGRDPPVREPPQECWILG